MPEVTGSITVLRRTLIIGLTAFLTVVDLFATQAILPSLARAYQVTPAAMGLAVNASTFGMAVAGLTVALFDRHIDRRLGTLVSLVVLAIPTALLANAPDPYGLCSAARRARTVHGVGLHADARLSSARSAARWTPAARLPLTSPAMSRATSSDA
jgi:predicted MFS family arabinose efflux permease